MSEASEAVDDGANGTPEDAPEDEATGRVWVLLLTTPAGANRVAQTLITGVYDTMARGRVDAGGGTEARPLRWLPLRGPNEELPNAFVAEAPDGALWRLERHPVTVTVHPDGTAGPRSPRSPWSALFPEPQTLEEARIRVAQQEGRGGAHRRRRAGVLRAWIKERLRADQVAREERAAARRDFRRTAHAAQRLGLPAPVPPGWTIGLAGPAGARPPARRAALPESEVQRALGSVYGIVKRLRAAGIELLPEEAATVDAAQALLHRARPQRAAAAPPVAGPQEAAE